MWGYKPYVPVAKRHERAKKQMQKLRKQGRFITPIELSSKKISTTFWGTSWCSHIESLSDFDNRLPRGRTYVRNGSVCHLAISEGKVTAIVTGNELYNVNVHISPLKEAKWQKIKALCKGQISSVLDLLSGKLSDGVMDIVCDKHQGMFPFDNEIEFDCDCFDWASMCKHVAAVLYGIGSRLDAHPEQLFILRAVDYNELIDIQASVATLTKGSTCDSKQLASDDLASIFGIEFDVTTPPSKAISKITKPKALTGDALKKIRLELAMSKAAFAKRIGVSAKSISIWEAFAKKKIHASVKSMAKLDTFLGSK